MAHHKTSQNGHCKCISHGRGAPRGQTTIGCPVGREVLLWPSFCAQNLYGRGRPTAMHLSEAGVTWVAHYLDDYITIGPPRSRVCKQNLEVMLSYCQRLRILVSFEKCAGSLTTMVFLGLVLDTVLMVVRLPEEKLQRIVLLVRRWMGKSACQKWDLESLLGHPQHTATVFCPGHTGREEEVPFFLPEDIYITFASDKVQTCELCSLCSKPGIEAPNN